MPLGFPQRHRSMQNLRISAEMRKREPLLREPRCGTIEKHAFHSACARLHKVLRKAAEGKKYDSNEKSAFRSVCVRLRKVSRKAA